MNYLRKRYPITIILKDGNSFSFHTSNAALVIASLKDQHGLSCDINNDIIEITSISWLPSNKLDIKIQGAINNGDIYHIFVKNDYKILPIKEKIVVDVGSNIGDSLIYFALRGAKKIIGVEPFPKNFQLAKKNIQLNDFSDRVELLLGGLSSKTGFITIDPNYDSNVDSKLEAFEYGISIPLFTLQSIVNNYNIPEGSILKVDCEGCEYDSILSAPEDALRRFSHIIIEYHFGYKDLKQKLENCGFRVSFSSPISPGFISKYFDMFKRCLIHFNSVQKNTKEYLESTHKINSQKNYAGYVGVITAIRD